MKAILLISFKFTKNTKLYQNKIAPCFKTSHKLFSNVRKANKKTTTSKADKQQQNTANIKQESLNVFSHESAAKYYKINILALLGYNTVLGVCLLNPEFPDYLRKTMMISFSLITATIIFIGIYSRRHISSISITRPSNILTIKTFGKFGLSPDGRTYQLPVKEVKELVPASDYIKTKKTGVFLLKPTEKMDYFRFFNFFFIRPYANNVLFDQLFKSKVRKIRNSE